MAIVIALFPCSVQLNLETPLSLEITVPLKFLLLHMCTPADIDQSSASVQRDS